MNILIESGLSFLGFSIPIVTELFILIDYGIYSIAFAALAGFYDILEMSYSIFAETAQFEQISSIIKRAMVLAGIFALFKLALTLISYILNPDAINKAGQTGTKIIQKVVIAVVLLMSSTFIFKRLGEFQKLVFENKIIQQIVLGPGNEEEGFKDTAKQFTNVVWLQFFTPKKDAKQNSKMSTCISTYNKVGEGDAEIIALIGCHYDYFDYFPIAPFIVGIMLIYYFVTYSLELCVRMVKLLVLEIIYPIPVIMSINPSDKTDRLGNYVKAYSGVYLQVFLRVLTLYLAFAVLNLITQFRTDFSLNIDETVSSGMLLLEGEWFLKVLIIIGVFKGMKELPKLVEDAIGVKLGTGTGNFSGALKGIVGGTAGLIGGTIAGAASGGLGGAVAGGLRGVLNGAKDGAASKNAGELIKSQIANYGKSREIARNVRAADGLGGYLGGTLWNKTGYRGRADRAMEDAQRRKDLLENFNKSVLDNYAKQVDPNTGYKIGSVDENSAVLAAQASYDNLLRSGTATATQIDAAKKAIETAKDSYYQAAFASFEASGISKTSSGKFEYKDSSGNVLDPRRDYTKLSDSQRAHYDLTRNASGTVLGEGTSADLYSAYKGEVRAVKTRQKDAENRQKSLKYQHATEADKWK